jgi:hypothetical protein
MKGVTFEMHRTAATLMQPINLDLIKKEDMLWSTRHAFGVAQTVVIHNVHSMSPFPQTVDSLAVGAPRIVIVTLLRIKPRPLKNLPGKRQKENIDMGKLAGISLCLITVAEVAAKYAGKLKRRVHQRVSRLTSDANDVCRTPEPSDVRRTDERQRTCSETNQMRSSAMD